MLRVHLREEQRMKMVTIKIRIMVRLVSRRADLFSRTRILLLLLMRMRMRMIPKRHLRARRRLALRKVRQRSGRRLWNKVETVMETMEYIWLSLMEEVLREVVHCNSVNLCRLMTVLKRAMARMAQGAVEGERCLR